MVENYLAQAIVEGQAAADPLSAFGETLSKLIDLMKPFASERRDPDPMAETWDELTTTQATLSTDIEAFLTEMTSQVAEWDKIGNRATRDNATLHAARASLHDTTERCRELTRQMDLAVKLAGRAVDIAARDLAARDSDQWANTDINRARRVFEDARAAGVEALRQTRYYVRQADWLQERFPDAEMRDVEGLVKLVDRAGIKAHDWSLTPGRYVGVAPDEEDEDFDFEGALREILIEIEELNEQAAGLAKQISQNLREIGP